MNRFPAKPVTIDGIRFASQKEGRRYSQLKLLERAGVINDLAMHPYFDMSINGKHYCRYTADFSYNEKDGRHVIEEVKSSGTRLDAAYRLRKKAAELFYGITVTEVLA